MTTEQAVWQRQAAQLLMALLERGAAAGLPPLAWTVAAGPPELHGRALHGAPAEQRAAVAAWAQELGLGPVGEVAPQPGIRRARARGDVTVRRGAARVVVHADIYE